MIAFALYAYNVTVPVRINYVSANTYTKIYILWLMILVWNIDPVSVN